MRDIIFIGHANPEDNDFTEWISSKLELEGYTVWSDLKSLYGGEEDFWNNIQETIRDKTIKYLLIYSNSTFNKDGVKDEYEYAKSISKQHNLKDFIIPLRIENILYNLRIGINRKNIIDFNESWAEGLKKLFRKLELDKIPKNQNYEVSISDWIINKYTTQNGLIKQDELYYSNWWPIPKIPDSIFVFQYFTEENAKTIIEEDADYPIIKHGNCLVSFEQNIKTISEKCDNIEIIPELILEISTNNILSGFDSKEFPNLLDSQNFLKRILIKGFYNLMYRNGLLRKKMSNKQYCFLFPLDKITGNKVTFSYHNRKKTKNLVGRYNRYFFWHFGVSTKLLLKPDLYYSLKSHVMFSDDGYNIWENETRLHRSRRSKCRMWFNEEWRDLLIAFINALLKENDNINLKLSNDFNVNMPQFTESFYANIGYIQPSGKDRLLMLDEHYKNIYELEDIDGD